MLGGEEMKIKEYRTIKGYTQREIAELLGIKQNTYSDKELGKSKFTIDEVKLIKELFEVTYDDLLS
jgi:transcriptional regulator with XRE-family HTH domain